MIGNKEGSPATRQRCSFPVRIVVVQEINRGRGKIALIQEISQADIEFKLTRAEDAFALFIYTPLCGTCKLTERMLNIIVETAPALRIYKANINRMPALAQAWRISSVPCLAVIHQGKIARQIYAMKSVDYLYDLLKPLM
jgi:thioredoxin-like negative regulator of GroEL